MLFSYWVSYQKETSVNYPMKNFIQLKENAKSWRKMMEYFNFYKYNVAVNVLKDFDTYGCYYQDPIVFPYHYKYYAGNFWWSKSNLLILSIYLLYYLKIIKIDIGLRIGYVKMHGKFLVHLIPLRNFMP